MPTDPSHDKPIPDSQADQTQLPRFDVPSEGDIDLGALESKATDENPLDAYLKAGAPPTELAPSHAGLPTVNLPSEGDVDLGALSRAGDDIPLADFVQPPVTPPPELPGSRPGLPRFDVPSEGDIDLGSLQSRADEEIPLADLPEQPSGQSLTSWTEVIRRQRAAAQAGQASAGDFKVDAPSDKDILIRFDEGVVPPRRTGDTSEILPGDLPVYTAPSGRSESDIDLGRAGLGGGTGESEVKFDILYPPSDAAGAMPAPGSNPGSVISFKSAIPVPSPSATDIPFASAVEPASAVALGTDSGPPGEGGRSSILDALLQDATGRPRGGSSASVLDFGSTPVGVPKPSSAPPTVPTPPSIDLGPGDPELSGRHLVDSQAELESEDAIDLYAGPAAAPSITDSGTLEVSAEAIEESQRKVEMQESSSVDLSSRPSYAGTEFDEALEAPSNAGSDSDVDLSLPAVEDEGGSSVIHRGKLDANSEAIAAEFKARRQAKDRPRPAPVTKAAKPRLVPVREEPAPGRGGRGALIGASVLGLLIGASGVLAAYFGGALPARTGGGELPTSLPPDVVRLNQALADVRKEAADAKAEADRQVAARKEAVDQVQQHSTARAAAEAQTKRAMADAQKAEADRTAAIKAATDARAAEQAAKNNLTTATKAADDARKQLTDALAAKQSADDALGGLKKLLADAGLDAANPSAGLKKLTDARTTAEAKAKEADSRLVEASKKVTDLTTQAETAKKSYDDARKAAEDAVKAREASDATVKAVGDRLAQAKFVGEKPDAAAILKGIDAAVKAGSGDATQALRDELVKVRGEEDKARKDLEAARTKLAAATKAATDAKAEAQKASAELTRVTTETAKLKQDAAAAIAKATAVEKSAAAARIEAEKAAAEARAATERSANDLARLKAENDRLARDLEAVKELAELIKTPAGQVATLGSRPDPDRLAEQFFGDGLRAFHRGQTVEAESAFRKAVQFKPNDARYHYLLGLSLWARKEMAAAEAEFEKGRDLELAARPTSRAISAALERIQGPARQAVDAYRP